MGYCDRRAERHADVAEKLQRVAERRGDRHSRRRDRWSQREMARRARAQADRAANSRVFGAVLIALGANWLLMELGLFPFGFIGLMAVGLAVLGLGLMGTAKAGSTGKLTLIGVAMTAALVMSSGVTAPVDGPFAGDAVHRPKTLAAVQDSYSLGVGELVVDLRSVSFGSEPQGISAHLIAGRLQILVPEGVKIEVAARIGGGGEIKVLDEPPVSGLGPRKPYVEPGWDDADRRVILNLDIELGGEITVTRAG